MMSTLPFDQRACFIAGQAKSGTTLLTALLDSHPELLVLPQETAYFPTVLRKYRDAGRRVQFDYLTKESFSRVLFGGEPIDQFGDGTTRRDYTYIDDIIQGTMVALKYEGPMFDVFNLGESQTIQLKDLIAAIETALGKKAKINRLPEQPGDMPLTCADISKARKLLGYNPKTKFSDGLPRFVDWFLRSRTQR